MVTEKKKQKGNMKRRTKTLKKGGRQVKVIYLAFIMKKFDISINL